MQKAHVTTEVAIETLSRWWASLDAVCRNIIAENSRQVEPVTGIPVYYIYDTCCACGVCNEARSQAQAELQKKYYAASNTYDRKRLHGEIIRTSAQIGRFSTFEQRGIIPVTGSKGTQFWLDLSRGSGSIIDPRRPSHRGCAHLADVQLFLDYAIGTKRWLEIDEDFVVNKANWSYL